MKTHFLRNNSKVSGVAIWKHTIFQSIFSYRVPQSDFSTVRTRNHWKMRCCYMATLETFALTEPFVHMFNEHPETSVFSTFIFWNTNLRQIFRNTNCEIFFFLLSMSMGHWLAATRHENYMYLPFTYYVTFRFSSTFWFNVILDAFFDRMSHIVQTKNPEKTKSLKLMLNAILDYVSFILWEKNRELFKSVCQWGRERGVKIEENC